jgi:uncharacterized protein YdcH (DUF465 family)
MQDRDNLDNRLLKLQNEHRELDKKVINYHKRRWLSQSDKDDLKSLKKLKLYKKDEMIKITNKINNLGDIK